MKKRVAATLLWFYAGWCVGVTVEFALGISPALGPILGTAAAAIVAGDPRGIIWRRRTTEEPKAAPTATVQTLA